MGKNRSQCRQVSFLTRGGVGGGLVKLFIFLETSSMKQWPEWTACMPSAKSSHVWVGCIAQTIWSLCYHSPRVWTGPRYRDKPCDTTEISFEDGVHIGFWRVRKNNATWGFSLSLLINMHANTHTHTWVHTASSNEGLPWGLIFLIHFDGIHIKVLLMALADIFF